MIKIKDYSKLFKDSLKQVREIDFILTDRGKNLSTDKLVELRIQRKEAQRKMKYYFNRLQKQLVL